jgi:tetratricopeptide (TPR) repeat protein
VNILLHTVNALLLWRLLLRLNIPGAWLAAAIFALHPVQVESVAWVTELKNVEMGFFFLLSLLAWTRFTGTGNYRAWRWYALSLLLYTLALCSKTTACTLPAALLLIAWLRGESIGWRRLIEVIPFLVLGAGMGMLTVWWERYHQGTQGVAFSMGLPERLLIASRAVWFYLGKLLWPASLTFSYPRWTISAADPAAYIWPLALCGLAGGAWFARRFVGRSATAALAFFVVTLGPVLGFVMLYTFRYSFVADHYQYLACIGPIALVSAGAESLQERFSKRVPMVIPGLCAILLAALAALTWWQSSTYHDMETLWSTTLARNPGSVLAHDNLADAFLREGRTDAAIAEFQAGIRIDPTYAELHNDLGDALLEEGRVREAVAEFEEAVRIKPGFPEAQSDLGVSLLGLGRVGEAIIHAQAALDIEPHNALFQNNLAWMLAAAPQPSLRDGPRAVKLASQASQEAGGDSPVILRTLAAAYAQAGQFPEAVETARQALQLAENGSNFSLAADLLGELKLYEAGKPYQTAP